MSTARGGPKAWLKSLLRILGAPVLNRIDGRVWNINWRVEHAWDLIRAEGELTRRSLDGVVQRTTSHIHGAFTQVQHSVGDVQAALATYTRSVEESSSYLATELRRLDEAIAAQGPLLDERLAVIRAEIQDRGVDELYREKLAHARDQKLSDLDGDIAWLINQATGHRGFAAQGDLWFNPPVTVELTAGSARLSGVNERIVELPFAFGALGRIPPGSAVLDIGSGESTFALSAAALGYQVSAIDLRDLTISHPNLTSFAGRFEDWKPPRAKLKGVFLISTIEHVGIGGYGETPYGEGAPGEGADRAMIERIEKVLAKDGLLTLTTPYGPLGVNALERIYDDAAVDTLLAGWTVLERRYAIRRDERLWESVDAPGSEDRGVVMILAAPPNGT